MLESRKGARLARNAFVALTLVSLIANAAYAAYGACPGDCNTDREVHVDELVTSVSIALGSQPLSRCTAADVSGDGNIIVDEIVKAILAALNNCAAQPTATPTVQPCVGATATACAGSCASSGACCFQSGTPSCFDPGIECTPSASATCAPGWYGFTACGNQQEYDDACQLVTPAPGTPTSTVTPTAAVATSTPTPTAPGNGATPTVQPCNPTLAPTCSASCASSGGCCFQNGSPSCFDPAIQCTPSTSATCKPGWYGYTACGNEQEYDDACQLTTPTAGTPTATPPPGNPTATATNTPPIASTPTATLTSSGGSTPTPTSPPAGDRAVTMINNCNFAVWVGVVGSVPSTPIPNCSASTPCPQGMACNTTAAPSYCVWALPPAQQGGFALAAAGSAGDQASFLIPNSQAQGTGNASQIMNVNFFGQTGCTSLPTVCCADATLDNCGTQTGCTIGGSDCTQDATFATCVDPCAFGPCGTSCTSAPCNSPSTSEPCAIGSGPIGAHTQAELNMFSEIVDSYDVSFVNGLNVAMEVRPVNGIVDASNPYTCGNPGGTQPLSAVQGCTYTFDTTVIVQGASMDYAPYLRNVPPGGAACTPTAETPDPPCQTAGEVCGLALSTDFTTLTTSCGTQIGWWSADEICSQVSTFNGGPFNCAGSTGQDTYANLYACHGANVSDCYNPSSNSQCCGCPVWPDVPLPNCATTTLGNCCYNSNSTWIDYAQPWAQFFKDGCSTAYSFPNDDKTTSFSCPTNTMVSSMNPNTTNYEVIYCPGGLTGW